MLITPAINGEAASCSPVMIHETSTTRVLYKAKLTKSKKDPTKPVAGEFVFQRKNPSQHWDTPETKPINQIELLTEAKLVLDTTATDRLFQTLLGLHAYFAQHKIPSRECDVPIGEGSGDGFGSLIQNVAKARGMDSLLAGLKWLAQAEDPKKLFAELERLNADSLQKIHSLSGIATLKKALDVWRSGEHRGDESFWQKRFVEMPFLLQQLFSAPLLYFDHNVYVGGKRLSGVGEKRADVVLKNARTDNAVIVELKHPEARLLRSEYRGDVYGPQADLTAAVSQLRYYKQTLLNNPQLMEGEKLRVIDPPCVLIAGDLSEFGGDPKKIQSFELFRNSLLNCTVITFDELFSKTETLIGILEGSVDEPIPF